ncbi:hypothetical protein CVT25_005361 [Psilocybe cyanescens]|uniref:Uncharacterized protein n=1 Tax=Psilocybe cyanescens TaxID=93625 RepID=A0A409XRT6_PSICY|nr:hypothetical protein CVT25_005361 [Psilocybe cyanescens]
MASSGLHLPASWSTDEPHALLWFEQAINAGVSIGCLYSPGIHIAVFATCTYYLIKEKKFSWFYQVYITVLFILASTNIACNVRFSELSWIDERNFPGGPSAFIELEDNLPVHIIGDAAANAITLMIYRCYIICQGKWYIVIVPILALVASTVLSILRTISAAQPASSLFAQNSVRFGLPYWALSMSLNMLVTSIIVTRLWMARRSFKSALDHEQLSMYTGIAAMLIESALPYSVVSLILIILYGKGNTAEILFIPLLPHVQCIAPELIIIRVRMGQAWSRTTLSAASPVSPMKFASNASSTSAPVLDVSGGKIDNV